MYTIKDDTSSKTDTPKVALWNGLYRQRQTNPAVAHTSPIKTVGLTTPHIFPLDSKENDFSKLSTLYLPFDVITIFDSDLFWHLKCFIAFEIYA